MQYPCPHVDLGSATCNCTEAQRSPSTAIDAALCDLLQSVMNFSDDDFDAACFSLSEAEIEGLVVQLLQHLTNTLDGKQLSGYLLTLRTETAPDTPTEEPLE